MLDHIFTHVENIDDKSNGKIDYVVLKFDYVVNEDIERAQVKQDVRWRYNRKHNTSLNNFYGNTDWEMEFGGQE